MLFLLLVLACLRPSEAAFLQECEGYIINLVRNPNQECSEYIYCNGDNSYYCNGQCDEPVTCYEEASTPSPTTTTEATTTTTEATTITTITTPSGGRAPTETPVESTTQSTPPQPQPQTVTPSTTSGTPLGPQVRCRQSVRNEVYPYPANDTYYYQCISKYLLLQQCPQNFYFDESQSKCIVRRSYR